MTGLNAAAEVKAFTVFATTPNARPENARRTFFKRRFRAKNLFQTTCLALALEENEDVAFANGALRRI